MSHFHIDFSGIIPTIVFIVTLGILGGVFEYGLFELPEEDANNDSSMHKLRSENNIQYCPLSNKREREELLQYPMPEMGCFDPLFSGECWNYSTNSKAFKQTPKQCTIKGAK